MGSAPRHATASAPGSLMLFGEHAVLHGHPAVVAAINRRITVRLTPRTDRTFTLASGVGRYEGSLEALAQDARFRFVHACLAQAGDSVAGGADLEIESDMAPTLGFGTSAAVTVATLAALDAAAGRSTPLDQQLDRTVAVIHAVQGGRGSGADAAASLHGGILRYRTDPRRVDSLTREPTALTAVYCGYKTPTPEVIASVERRFAEHPDLLAELFASIGSCADQAGEALAGGNLAIAGALMTLNQTLMDALGLTTPELGEILADLRDRSPMYGAKISGSGLGDCVVGLGDTPDPVNGYETHRLRTDPEGCRHDPA